MPSTKSIRSILAATDLQGVSRGVCDTAGRLARAADATLLLLHVVERKDTWFIPDVLEEGPSPDQVADARRALNVQTRELEEAGIRAESTVLQDRPAHEGIVEHASETGADLVVVGSAAREGRGHRLGSTADRVLRASPIPCLIARGEAAPPFRRIAALTDFSARARGAAEVAAGWQDVLGDSGATLDIVHVGERVQLNHDPSLEQHLQKKLEEEVTELEQRIGGTLGRTLRWARHPVDGVLELAEEEGYDLLVVSTHGHGPIRRALIGSVAIGLAQSASCPVLVVPAPED